MALIQNGCRLSRPSKPVKLIVPGHYGTYWVKHLSEIEVIDREFDGFWMKPAYRIPDNACACVEPTAEQHALAYLDGAPGVELVALETAIASFARQGSRESSGDIRRKDVP